MIQQVNVNRQPYHQNQFYQNSSYNSFQHQQPMQPGPNLMNQQQSFTQWQNDTLEDANEPSD